MKKWLKRLIVSAAGLVFLFLTVSLVARQIAVHPRILVLGWQPEAVVAAIRVVVTAVREGRNLSPSRA